MNTKETEVILEAIRLIYPNGNSYSAEDRPKVLALWTMLFEDTPYEDVNAALKIYMSDNTSGFAPTPGQLKQYITKAKTSSLPSAEEAWALVRKAVSNGIYGSQEEFDALPEICQRVVGSPQEIYDMAMLTNEGLSVSKTMFLKRYPEAVKEEQFKLALPKRVAEQTERIADQNKVKALAERIGYTD